MKGTIVHFKWKLVFLSSALYPLIRSWLDQYSQGLAHPNIGLQLHYPVNFPSLPDEVDPIVDLCLSLLPEKPQGAQAPGPSFLLTFTFFSFFFSKRRKENQERNVRRKDEKILARKIRFVEKPFLSQLICWRIGGLGRKVFFHYKSILSYASFFHVKV